MKVFFYLITIIYIIELIYSYIKTKRIVTISNVFFIGVIFNFILYLLNWSNQFLIECKSITFLIISISEIIVLVFDVIYIRKQENSNCEVIDSNIVIKRIRAGKHLFSFSFFILLLCMITSIIENYLTYEEIFPFLNKIDSHKNSMAIWGTLWKVLYPIGLLSFYYELKTNGHKKIIEYCVVFLTSLYLLLGIGGRFWPLVGIITVSLFYLINNKKKITFKKIIIMIILGLLIIWVMLMMGMTRLKNGYLYSNLIGYIGPFSHTSFGEIISWYYGYFPYSFYNLNLTLINIQTNGLYTYGQFFLIPFLYLTKLYKLLDIDYIPLAMSIRVITNRSATVATAFFEFYADFQYLFFMPIIFYVWIINEFQRRDTLFAQGAYVYCLVMLYFFNFYNVFSSGIPYTFILVWYLFNRFFVIKGKNKNE